MKVSLSKLEEFIYNLGYVPKRYFTIKKLCVYIEVIGVKTANTFLVYVPSKYSVKIKDRTNIYKLEYMDVSDDGTTVGEFAKDADDFELENVYDNIEIDQRDNVDMIDRLEENYRRQLSLKDENDNKVLLDIFRQLRRLRFCVQTMPYKLCIIYKNYMCCIRRDETFEGYKIKDHTKDKIRKLIITTDMESLYERTVNIDSDLYIINSGINRILDRNQGIQALVLKKMMEVKNDVLSVSETVYNTKNRYTKNLSDLKNMLNMLAPVEEKIVEQIMGENENHEMNNQRGLHSDMEHNRKVSELESKLSKINSVKQSIIHNILEIKYLHDNVSLTVDKIMFDNSVMLDTIYKNFEKLKKINI